MALHRHFVAVRLFPKEAVSVLNLRIDRRMFAAVMPEYHIGQRTVIDDGLDILRMDGVAPLCGLRGELPLPQVVGVRTLLLGVAAAGRITRRVGYAFMKRGHFCIEDLRGWEQRDRIGKTGVLRIRVDVCEIIGYTIDEDCTIVRFGRYGRGFSICCGGKVLFFYVCVQVLPRLALTYYCLIAAVLALGALWLSLRRKPCAALMRQLFFAPFAWLAAQLLLKGLDAASFQLEWELGWILLLALVIYSLLTLAWLVWRQHYSAA